MPKPSVTIAFVQRERFSTSEASLESILRNTPDDVALLCIDAGSPRRTRNYLDAQGRAHGFRIRRVTGFLSPIEARNIALEEIDTKYVVFVDNDVIVTPGWLEALVACAENTGADVVTPLICQGPPLNVEVHTAGGDVRIREQDGKRVFSEVQRFLGRPVAEVEPDLVPGPTRFAEFHCLLARTALFNDIGPLDEGLLATSEHLDFCLSVIEHGGAIHFEPRARVTYLRPPPVRLSDIPFFMLRWSDDWAETSERHFHAKWNVVYEDRVVRFAAGHRRLALRRLRALALRFLGWRLSQRLSAAIDNAVVSWAKRRHAGT